MLDTLEAIDDVVYIYVLVNTFVNKEYYSF